jgi:hypothetical protein
MLLVSRVHPLCHSSGAVQRAVVKKADLCEILARSALARGSTGAG